MRGGLGELQHVHQALARIRDFLLGERGETRVETEPVERVAQVAREGRELSQQVGLPLGWRSQGG